MSYILDALRRADAERERGAVPGLHAQNIPADAEPAARDFRPLIWAAGGAGALLVAVVVVLVFGPWRSPSAPVAVAAGAPVPALETRAAPPAAVAPAQGETPPQQPGAIAPAALPVEPPIRGAASRRAAAEAPPAAPARVVAAATPPTGDRLAERAAQGRVAVLGPRAAPAAAPAAVTQDASADAPAVEHYGPPLAAPAKPNAIVGINDLPPATRQALPRLAVGGAIYSDAPSARMLILNGQVWHEGDKPAPDTVLEQIRHKSAVLNYRGTRYEITF